MRTSAAVAILGLALSTACTTKRGAWIGTGAAAATVAIGVGGAVALDNGHSGDSGDFDVNPAGLMAPVIMVGAVVLVFSVVNLIVLQTR